MRYQSHAHPSPMPASQPLWVSETMDQHQHQIPSPKIHLRSPTIKKMKKSEGKMKSRAVSCYTPASCLPYLGPSVVTILTHFRHKDTRSPSFGRFEFLHHFEDCIIFIFRVIVFIRIVTSRGKRCPIRSLDHTGCGHMPSPHLFKRQ
mmetsp:Transcript_10656/g.19435  ORF Transcript_10656/g.19435 Transcript_10656/m.19435 type:complete len:147 (-) Transcript_10656:2181-2621(-)